MAEPIRNDLAPATNPYLRAVEAAFCEDWPLVVEILGAKTFFELDIFAYALAPLLRTVREMQIAKAQEVNQAWMKKSNTST
jgi:hypothetical protein